MKQRLLLVLLALFTSIGWMNAKVVLTVDPGTTGTLTFSKASGTDKDAISIIVDNSAQTGITTSYKLTGKENTIEIGGSLYSLTVDANIQLAKISTASDLKTLVFKKKVESINFTDNNTKLTSLTADGCGLGNLPENLRNALADNATVSLKNNELTNVVTGLKLNAKITYNFDGNKITSWPDMKDAKATINYGSQSLTLESIPTAIANQWFDIYEKVTGTINSSLKKENATYAWRKGTSGSFSTSLIKQSETYPSNFQFFSSNAYQSGTYQCQISPKSGVTGPTYIVTVDVQPAVFDLKIAASPMEGAKNFQIANGSKVGSLATNNPLEVEKGAKLTFSAQAKDGYTFSDFEVKGLNKVSTNVYEVVGLGFDVKELTATAVFKKNTYKITVDASSEHGSYVITNKTDNSEVTNGKTVSYNDKLIIKATPEKGYTPRVIVNGSEIKELNNPILDSNTGTYTFTTNEIKKASTIQILFDKTETYKLKVQYVNGFTLKVNGNKHTEKGTGEYSAYYKDATTLLFPAGTLINLEMIPDDGVTTKIKKILLNGALVASAAKGQFEMPTGSSSKDDPKSAFVTFETSELAEITVTAKDSKNINTNLQGQIYTYDGNAHAFQYDVTPTGLTGFTVKYTNATIGVENYQTTQPTTVGTYKVLVTRSADSNYAAYNSNTNTDLTKKFAIKIDKATPTITTAPTVTVTTDGDYSISGGVAQVGGKTVAGEWTVVNKDSEAITKPETSNAEKSHIATVAFIPSDQNNIFGTYHVVRASEKFGVKKFVMISTDKAVNPTNLMGATKRFCEMILQSRQGSNTEFCAVRFGNVLGSNGSVIPLFKRQIANGGPVTITDKRIIRYFMTIPEAAMLVLEAGAMAKQSQIFVLDMGQPVKILTLAENLIRLSGLEPYRDIEIKEIGLRPGEKLYEELLMQSEHLLTTENEKIFVEEQQFIPKKDIMCGLISLDNFVSAQRPKEELIALMRHLVPTFRDPDEVNREAVKRLEDDDGQQEMHT